MSIFVFLPPLPYCVQVLSHGGSVWHELNVYEGEPKLPDMWRNLVRCLRQAGITEANRDVDLAHVNDEQAQFVIALAEVFRKSLYLPLPDAAGSGGFRDKVAAYLNRYAGAHQTHSSPCLSAPVHPFSL